MSKQNTFPRPTCLHGAIRSALLASALAIGGVLSQAVLAEKLDPALYDQDTEQLLVYLHDGIKPDDLAKRYGLKPVRTLVSKINAHVFATDSVEAARKILPALREDKTVKAAFNNRRTTMVPDLAPNDPYYSPDPNLGLLGQWHLDNQYGWPDINAEGAWDQGVTGEGVIIGIVDSGVQPNHEDLSVNADWSFDFVEHDTDPTPCYDQYCSRSYHGTAVAGVAAAIGNNGTGVTGVATQAQVAGLRIGLAGTFNPATDVGGADSIVDAIHYGTQGIYNAQSKFISIKNHSYGSPTKYSPMEATNYALRETAAAGMVHVLAAGNDRQDRNTLGRSANPDGIAVTALGYDGRYADYSNYGASVFVTAPSMKSGGHHIGITTTDLPGFLGANGGASGLSVLPGSYSATFGGTSAAAPQVAGALALVRELRPDLNTRLAKHLLVNGSLPVDIGDNSREGGWTVNAAGCGFNPNYGFGLLQADKLVKLAREGLTISPPTQWNGNSSLGGNVVPPAPPIYWPSGPSNTADGEPIPDGGEPLTHTIKVDDCPAWGCLSVTGGNGPLDVLEEVGVTLDIEHSRRGDIEVVLISPNGTASRLVRSYTKLPEAGWDIAQFLTQNPFIAEEYHHIRHTFWTNAFWGEWPEGEWTLQIHDKVRGETGVVNSYNLHLHMGSVTAPADFTVCENYRRLRDQKPSLSDGGFKP